MGSTGSLDSRFTSVRLSTGRGGNRIGLVVEPVGKSGLYVVKLILGGNAGITLTPNLDYTAAEGFFESYRARLQHRRVIRLD